MCKTVMFENDFGSYSMLLCEIEDVCHISLETLENRDEPTKQTD